MLGLEAFSGNAASKADWMPNSEGSCGGVLIVSLDMQELLSRVHSSTVFGCKFQF